jgi:transposase
MEPQRWPEPAAEVVRAVQAKYRGRQVPLPVAVRDRFGELSADAEFASAFAVRGPRAWSPGRLALVTVLQMAENLTDRQAAEAVRDRLSWAYALGLDLADAGFDHTVLSEFRSRVVAHHLEETVLDLLLTRLTEMGLVGAGGKQRTDSTSVIAAVRDVNRLELVSESVRAAVEALSAATPGWLAGPGHRRARLVAALRAPDRLVEDAGLQDQARRPRAGLRPGRLCLGQRGLRAWAAGMAAGVARSAGAAPGAGSELHPHHRT